MSIRIKLTMVMLAIGLIPTLIISILAYLTISNELTKKTEDQLSSIATSQQQKITALLQQRQEDVTKLANQFDLQNALNMYLSSNHRLGLNELNALLLNKKTSSPEIQSIQLIGTDGVIIASTINDTAGSQLKPDDYYIAPGQESNISVKSDPRDNIDKLQITTKLHINKNDAGYLNFIFRIDDITAAIQDYSGLGNTGETVIESQDVNGNAISLFPLRFDTDAALKTNLNSLSLATNVNADFRQATDYRGSEVLLTARSIGFANWVLATKIDMDEALAPINQLRTIMFTIVGVSSLVIILFSLYFTQFFIAPILRVVQVSQNYGRGDFSSRVGFQGTDEIGMLGASINAMGSSLQETVSHLEAQRNRLTVILNSTAESIMAIDKSGTIVLANAATEALTHLPEREIVNHNIADVFHFKKNLQVFAVDYNKPGTNIYPDLELVDANETVHYLKLIVAQVNTSASAASSSPQTIITIHDETRSRELENMKVDFVSMAAHELRTPLAATRGYLELVSFKEGSGVPTDVKNYLQQALKSTNELGDLIDNLLGVTRIERGTLTLHPEKVDIAADIQQAIQSANFAATDKRIAITYDGPTSGCFVLADQIALHEVINNLITNAIKYTNPGGEVTILLGRETDHYVISFKDTGIGIPKQAMQNLFTKFYRVRGGLNSGSTGTGLGLFIAKSIIERHGGSISVESQEGVGSTFTVTIPMLNDQQYAELQSEQRKAHTVKGSRGWTTKNITR